MTTLRELLNKTKKATKKTTDKILDTDLNETFKIKPDPNPEKTIKELKESSKSILNGILLIFGLGIGITVGYFIFGVVGLGVMLANLIFALVITGIFNTNYSTSLLWLIVIQILGGMIYFKVLT